MSDDFFSSLVKNLSLLTNPIVDGFQSTQSLSVFFRKYGWNFDPSTIDLNSIQGIIQFNQLAPVLEDLGQKLLNGASIDYGIILQTIQPLIEEIQNLSSANTTTQISTGAFGPSFWTDFWDNFPQDLINDLLIQYVQSIKPGLFLLFRMLGIFDSQSQIFNNTAGRVSYDKRIIHWDRLPKIISPTDLLSKSFPLSSLSTDPTLLLGVIQDFFNDALGFSSQLQTPDQSLLNKYYSGGPAPANVQQLKIPVFSANNTTDGTVDVSLSFLPIPDSTGTINGLVISPSVTGMPTEFDFDSWVLKLSGNFATENNLLLEIRPTGFTAACDINDLTATASLAYNPANPPATLFGTDDSFNVKLSSGSLTIGISGSLTNPEITAELDLQNLQLNIDFSNSDSLIKDIIQPQSIQFQDVGIIWSSKTGLSFKGSVSATLQTTIAINQKLGPVELDSISVGLSTENSNLVLTATASGSVHLGPINATVDNIGLNLILKPQLFDSSAQDTTKSLPFSLEFHPPEGIGLSVDADVVSGGGYLAFDDTKKEYSGALQLEAGGIGLSAYGVLDTIMPGGEKGYSLVLIIHAQFGDPGLEIGFGVALTGIGGLVAVNRTMDMNILLQDVQNHKLKEIMFNEHPVDNAPQIISELSALFPIEKGEFVFGPMAQLAWGEGSLVVANVGVFLELVKAPKIVLLGTLSSQIPDPDNALISINIDVDGFIDFQAKNLGIDATLYNSYVVIFSISGQFALRASWGDNPIFLLSLGGFNPHFQPPPSFPTLDRIRIALCTTDNPILQLDSYLAVTSNSFQVGAHLYAYAEASGFYAKGDLGFDALFIFSPFSFLVDIYADFEIGKIPNNVICSASLTGSLSGPTPWVADGNVTFTILCFHPSVSFHAVIGSQVPPPPPPTEKDVFCALQTALGVPANWSSSAAQGALNVVSILQTPPPDNTIMMDPVGTLAVKQSKVPMMTPITAYNNTPLSPSPLNLSISQVQISGDAGTNWKQISSSQWQYHIDEFPPASYQILTDDQKIASPSYQPLPGGVNITPINAIASSDSKTSQINYNTKFVDQTGTPTSFKAMYIPPKEWLLTTVSSGTKMQSILANTGPRKFSLGPDSKISIGPDSYTVVSTDQLKPVGMPAGITSVAWAQAYGYMQAYLKAKPQEQGYIQIMPIAEVPQN